MNSGGPGRGACCVTPGYLHCPLEPWQKNCSAWVTCYGEAGAIRSCGFLSREGCVRGRAERLPVPVSQPSGPVPRPGISLLRNWTPVNRVAVQNPKVGSQVGWGDPQPVLLGAGLW